MQINTKYAKDLIQCVIALDFLRFTFLLCLFLIGSHSFCLGQEEIKVMYYNILNFPNPTNLDPVGNDATRAAHFSDIVEEADADIVLIQELKSSTGADMLLTAMNTNSNGKTFARAPNFFGYGGGSNQLGNMLFYNTANVSFVQQMEIPLSNTAMGSSGNVLTGPRKKSYYEVQVFSPGNTGDFETVHLIDCHFKGGDNDHAGSTTLIPDNERRVLDAMDVIDFINNNTTPNANIQTTDNIIVGGDLNFYSHLANNTSDTQHNEPAYDVLINNTSYPIQLIDKLGAWVRNDNTPSNVCKYTQSTRNPTNLFGNDGAGGALDDRFDFILFNDNIDNGTNKLSYVNTTYEVLGTPKIYNGQATSSTSPVANQIYQMSDHYPVVAHFLFTSSTACNFSNAVVSNTTCVGNDYEFEVDFTVVNGSGTYEVVDITNGNNVLATTTSSPVTVTLPNQMTTNSFDIVVRDMSNTVCQSNIMTIHPIACATSCFMGINSVSTSCQTNNTYSIDVCFDYSNPLSSNIEVLVDGTNVGTYPYPATSGGCVQVAASAINIIGDGTIGVPIEIQDAGTILGGTPFMSEIHYDDVGTDINEFVEITAPVGTDLSAYQLVFYNGGSNGLNATVYNTVNLMGVISNQQSGCGTNAFSISGIQNGPHDGIALVEIATSNVLEFISYEGLVMASDGPAVGMTSTDIGVLETSGTLEGESLQLTDTGWMGPLGETPNVINVGLSTCGAASACGATSTFDEPACVPVGCSMSINQVTASCVSGDQYDVEICFDFYNPISSNVRVYIDGSDMGVYPYPASIGGCITVPASTINLTGDGTPNIAVELEDAASGMTATPPFISEIHFDNTSIDVGEFIEISGVSGTDLSLYELVVYDNNDGKVDATTTLSGILGDEGIGCAAIAFDNLSTQYYENGPEAFALVEASTQQVIEFISFGITIIADDGPAQGMTSTDVGVTENSSTPIGASLKKEDAGWVVSNDDSPGIFNMGLTSCGASGMVCAASSTYNEPSCGSGCPTNLIENGMSIPSGTYQASSTILSQGTIDNGATVIFDAGNSIELGAGFFVPLGAEFLGVIGGCTN